MAFPKQEKEVAIIGAANIQVIKLTIRGTAPLVMNNFSQKAKNQMMAEMAKTKAEKNKNKKDRPPRNYDEDYKGAFHVAAKGWYGIPAPAFRNAMIRACSAVKGAPPMTQAKMAVFIDADGFELETGKPLVKIEPKFKPRRTEMPVRNDNGAPDIRIRPMWDEGWEAELRIRFDADMITPESVVNLVARAGLQVGILEGRPFSKDSAGMGWGTFEIVNTDEKKKAA